MSNPNALEFPGAPLYDVAEAERPLRIHPLFVATTGILLVISAGLYYAGLTRALATLWGLWTFGVIMASPRAGIVLSLLTQVFDVALNPEVGSQWAALSGGRIILLLTVFSYLARVVFGHRPSLRATRGTIWMFVFFLVWSVISLMWSTHYGVALTCIAKLLIQLVVLIAAVDLLADRRAVQQTIFLLGVGSAAGGLFALFGGIALRSQADARMALQGIGINSFAISVGLGGVAMAALAVQRRTPAVVLSSVLVVILTTLVALRTGTRAVIIGAPLSVMVGAAVGYWRKLHKLILLTGLVAVLSGGTFLWAVRHDFIRGKLRDRVLTVFAEHTYETNTRWQLWSQAIDIYLRRPIGYGAGHEPIAYAQHTGFVDAGESHNVFFTVLVEFNPIGVAIFLLVFAVLIRALFRVRSPAMRAGAAMFLAYALFNGFKGSILENRVFWQPILLAMVMIEADSRLSPALQRAPGDHP